jgi:hypothetical protein
MQNILYHTVIAKKKGPHTSGTLARALPKTFAEASLLALDSWPRPCDAALLKMGCMQPVPVVAISIWISTQLKNPGA